MEVPSSRSVGWWADARGIEVYLVPGEIPELMSFEVLQLVFNLKGNKSVQNLGYNN